MGGGDGKFGVNMVGGMRIKELGDDSSDEERKNKDDSSDSIDPEDVRIQMKDREEGGQDNKLN